MRARVVFTNEAGEESVENVRWTDEIAEAEGMTDEEADAMERELSTVGRYHLNADRCIWRERT